jgi:diguanylate cyclase (GGDEF)-like protein/putative nucleotidyltransferase with HDIG domain
MNTYQQKRLYWLLIFISVLGSLLICKGFIDVIRDKKIEDYRNMIELALLYVCLIPWSVKLPSGASWRPGVPLLMMSIFLMPPTYAMLVPLPGLILITARARARWWKYIETFSHMSLGLFAGGHVYLYVMARLPDQTVATLVAMICALLTHLVVNRSVSAVIVAHREKRTLTHQLVLTIRELHWGYINSYLLILMVSLVSLPYRPFAIVLVAVIQVGIFLAVGHYSTVEKLQKSVWTDGLTQVENRNAWEHLVKTVENQAMIGTLAVIDVNDFKLINDKYGHVVGDEVLRDVATALRAQFEKKGRIFRFGGDEFVVYSPNVSNENVYDLLRKAQLEMLARWATRGIQPSLSFGSALSPADSSLLNELFRIADARMYGEKRSQRLTMTGMEVGIPDSVQSLILAIESRDPYTAGHNLRVAFYALQLAQQMGLESQKLKAIFRGCLVHDVGKIGIPDVILNKPGKLTLEEMDIIKQHPEVGFEMCSKLNFAQDELDVIRHHHERFDGTGYPLLLRAEKIPLLAAITTVADVYDAVTSSRSYRQAWTHEQAMQYMDEQVGLIFEPSCIHAWKMLNTKTPMIVQFTEWVGRQSFTGITRAM